MGRGPLCFVIPSYIGGPSGDDGAAITTGHYEFSAPPCHGHVLATATFNVTSAASSTKSPALCRDRRHSGRARVLAGASERCRQRLRRRPFLRLVEPQPGERIEDRRDRPDLRWPRVLAGCRGRARVHFGRCPRLRVGTKRTEQPRTGRRHRRFAGRPWVLDFDRRWPCLRVW